MLSRFIRAVAALALAASVSIAQAGPYLVTVMDLPGGTESQGFDINNLGVFVGTSQVGGESVGYLMNGAVATILTVPPGGLGATALGISDTGTVVGSYYTGAGGTSNSGYIYAAGSYATLDLPGASDTYLRGISPDGRYVTGYAVMADGTFNSFVYDQTAATITSIIVNSPALTIAQGVTNAGLVVGNYRELPAPGPFPAGRFSFTYDTGTGIRTDFSIPTGDIRYRGINENGLIDGFISDVNGNLQGFIGSAALFDTFNMPGATSTVLEGINDAGWLSGWFLDANGVGHAFLARPVPEPGTLLLLGLGLAGLAASRRRRG